MLHSGCAVTVCSVAPGDPGETRNSRAPREDRKEDSVSFPFLVSGPGKVTVGHSPVSLLSFPLQTVSPDLSRPSLSTLQVFEAQGHSKGHPGG